MLKITSVDSATVATVYTTTDRDVVVFTKRTWNTTQFITVRSSAAIKERPVCNWQRQRCSALAHRQDKLLHNSNSSDPKYNNDAIVVHVNVNVKIVYDPLPPPEIVSSKFLDILNAIDIIFDSDTDQAELSGSFDCHHVLNLTASPSGFLGMGAKCSWPQLHQLRVTFGQNPDELDSRGANVGKNVPSQTNRKIH